MSRAVRPTPDVILGLKPRIHAAFGCAGEGKTETARYV
ncbi:hypothetical protein GGD55_005878 [Rhizobium giardinii]|uniref:Uncharacterized protein n=1 Tax=Rhizobium giardinii TaxID=56731 RepID=A0A7W8XBD2_9HYPH|nr:hypothetical protein [Rhizobium giardinii]